MGRIIFSFALLGVIFMPAQGQEFRSTISGAVMDPQKAVIPGAKVVAKEIATGIEHSTVSGQNGQYTLPFLPPGTYRITAETAGFRKYVREKLKSAGVSRVEIERAASKVKMSIHTPRPGIVIGKKGAGIEQLKKDLQ